MESIVWWYISPCILGIILVTAGETVDESGMHQIDEQLAIYYMFCGLLSVGIYFLNRSAATNKFKPLLDKINQRLKEMKQGGVLGISPPCFITQSFYVHVAHHKERFVRYGIK